MQQGLIQRDKQVNWHPYTQMKIKQQIPIVRGNGAYLFDADGKRYIDAISSWWVNLHGHAHPYIAEKVAQQLRTLEQVIFAGFTHPAAIELSERLLSILPENQSKVFYSDNGSTAVEVALKMCIQYYFNQGIKKNKIVTFKNGYHGDTFGTMSVSGRGLWTTPFNDLLFEVIFIDTPTKDNLPDIIQTTAPYVQDIACFVYEPLIQGSGGMLMHKAEDLSALMHYFRTQHVLMIQDEIFVGFGRTGKLFAADHLTESPDVMCFSKGLTGGTMALGITTCKQEIYDAFYCDDRTKTLFHGHSFTGNPLACAAALASMDLLLQEDTQQNISRISKQHTSFLQKIKHHKQVKDIRQCGTVLAIEWQTNKSTSYLNDIGDKLYTYFLDKGVILRPLGNVLYVLPPYCISIQDIDYIYNCIENALEEI